MAYTKEHHHGYSQKKDLNKIISDPAYIGFIQIIFSLYTVVFVGISADDRAAGGFIEKLNSYGLDLGSHFWLTSITDLHTAAWASRAGIQIIRYTPSPGGGHSDELQKIFSDLETYTSKDSPASVIIPQTEVITEIQSADDLRLLSEDELRSQLSGYARFLIEKNGGQTDTPEYKEFVKSYSPRIHQAWHVTSDAPYNKFYSYEIVEKISGKTFSNVWKIVSQKGEFFALKIVQIDNLSKGAHIESFRRGVESLKFLTNAKVPHTAFLQEAHEIPTDMIMDFIEGSNLADVVQSNVWDFWRHGLKIFINICNHLQFSHNLPQGVLHRDVRPSNVMLPNFYVLNGEAKFHAVLLNYDMSWHGGSRGESISGNVDEIGFYAPEQLISAGIAARTTQVDSFGVGMSLFYAYSGKMPPRAGSGSTEWASTLSNIFKPNRSLRWHSAPERLKRLIDESTQQSPAARPLVGVIFAILGNLHEAAVGNQSQLPPDFWAEELCCRVIERKYLFDINRQSFKIEPIRGRTIEFYSNLANKSIILEFRTLATEATERSRAPKLWATKLSQASSTLSAVNWKIHESRSSGGREIALRAEIEVSCLEGNLEKVVEATRRALDQVRLD